MSRLAADLRRTQRATNGILLVEDSENDAVLIIAELQRHGYAPEYPRVEEATAFREELPRNVEPGSSAPPFTLLAT